MANYKTYRIGDVVELCTETNSDLKYGLEHVRGISNTKEIQQTKANLIERNLAPFHVVRRNEFVYNRRTSRNGERVGLGFNNTDETLLITEDYVHFRVKDENQLNPDYLYLFFKRDEFDREARYNSWGSATEFFNWDDMQAIKINVPPIEEQRRIVSEYQTVERRIQNNEQLIKKLEETAQAIYHHTFVEGIDENNLPQGWRMGHLGDIMNISSGKSVVDKVDQRTDYYKYPVAGASGIIGYSSLFNKEKRILTTGRVGTLGVINKYDEAVWCADNVLIAESEFYEFSCISLKNVKYEEISKGGVQALLTQGELNNYPIVVPVKEVLDNFESKVEPIFTLVKTYTHEIYHLRTLLSLLTSKLS